MPSSFTTGSRRTCLSAMLCRASWISSSGLQVTTFVVAISPTASSPAKRFLVPIAIEMSRSVTTPSSFPQFPTTGNMPQLFTHRSSTAAPTFVPVPQHTADCVMTSFTLTAGLLPFCRFTFLSSANGFESSPVGNHQGGPLQRDELTAFEFAERPCDGFACRANEFGDLFVGQGQLYGCTLFGVFRFARPFQQ